MCAPTPCAPVWARRHSPAMHDIRLIRDNPEAFDAGLARRGVAPVGGGDPRARRARAARSRRGCRRRRAAATRPRRRSARRWAEGDTDEAEALKAEVAELKETLPALEQEDRELAAELQRRARRACPTCPPPTCPKARTRAGNVEVAALGHAAQLRLRAARNTPTSARALGLDFETGAAISGARFTFLRGQMARLQRALGAVHARLRRPAQHGYIECAPPLLVRDEAVFGTGQLPKFAEDLFRTTDGRWLIPTAEVSLTNSVREQILDRRRAADPPDRAHPLLPLRGRRGGQGHARLHPPAPVREGRAGHDLPPRGSRGRARAA